MMSAALLVSLGVPTRGQQTVEAPDVQALGPQVGAQVPAFSLQDQHGDVRTLESVMGPQGLMLVFVRSADW
jgi:hypothetical protein